MITVAVAIIIRNFRQGASQLRTEVLLCQRKKTARYGLKWEFPGGKVETGESFTECLQRELHEELGVEATIGDLYERLQYVYPDSGTFDVNYYRVASFEGTIVNHVFESTAWVPLSKLDEYDILEGNAPVIGKLINEYAAVTSGKN